MTKMKPVNQTNRDKRGSYSPTDRNEIIETETAYFSKESATRSRTGSKKGKRKSAYLSSVCIRKHKKYDGFKDIEEPDLERRLPYTYNNGTIYTG